MEYFAGASDGLEPSSYREYPYTILPLKVRYSFILLSAMCVTTYLKAMLTDENFAFRFFSCRKLRST